MATIVDTAGANYSRSERFRWVRVLSYTAGATMRLNHGQTIAVVRTGFVAPGRDGMFDRLESTGTAVFEFGDQDDFGPLDVTG